MASIIARGGQTARDIKYGEAEQASIGNKA
jgi:hypothetical protein